MRRVLGYTTLIVVATGLILVGSAGSARAQFINPTTPSTLPSPVQKGLGQLPSNVSSEQLQKIMLLRYLQQRGGSGSRGVQRGVPQFVPFGNFMPNQGLMPAAPADQNAVSNQPDPDDQKSNAEKKAQYQAQREERKRKARERADARKAEAAARKAKAAADDPS